MIVKLGEAPAPVLPLNAGLEELSEILYVPVGKLLGMMIVPVRLDVPPLELLKLFDALRVRLLLLIVPFIGV